MYLYLYFHLYIINICIRVSDRFINPADFRYKLYLENEDDEVGAVMETGSVEEEEDEEDKEKENQRPKNQIGRFEIF